MEGEALNHRQLRHPHIIEFKRVFLTPDNIAIVMVRCFECPLYDAIAVDLQCGYICSRAIMSVY